MKILITGASGQDGILLINYLLQNGLDVDIYALSQNSKKFFANLNEIGGPQLTEVFNHKGQFITCDINDHKKITAHLELIQPHAIFLSLIHI